jgi:DNA transformation protein
VPLSAGYLNYIVELFAPWAQVAVKRMFGGAGVYRDGRMFALADDDQIYLKVNGETRPAFEAAGSRPFVFVSKDGQGTAMSYWSLPPGALDDSDALCLWAERAWAAASQPKSKAKPSRTGSLSKRELAELPLKPSGKPKVSIKKR